MKVRRVYTGGTFDLLHPGHINLLRECALLGSVTVGLNTDEFVQSYKGRTPVMTYTERALTLHAVRHVDAVVPCDGDSATLVDRARPDYLVIGSDWAGKDYYTQMGFSQAWLDQRNIKLVYVPYTRGVSTSDIRIRLS